MKKERFTQGSGAMGMNIIDFELFDKSKDYFSMPKLDTSDFLDKVTILKISHSMGGQTVTSVDKVPEKIEGYIKH